MPADDLERLRLRLSAQALQGAPALCAALGWSQATFSRRIRAMGADVLTVGRARSTRYALHRHARDLPSVIPLYEIRARGSRHLADLHLIAPSGLWLAPTPAGTHDVEAAFYPDLPWFLDAIRPSGFLGRQLPHLHPHLENPRDVRLWGVEHILRWAIRHGTDLPGALIVGEEAFSRHLEALRRCGAAPPIPAAAREQAYTVRAEAALQLEPFGSSAAGEQPKFLATFAEEGTQEPVPVLVKFSARATHPTAQRMADLLVCEHLAATALHDAGIPAARTALLLHEGRTFLEVTRFDRDGQGGRSGVVSLSAADAHHIGSPQHDWGDALAGLAEQGLLSAADVLLGQKIHLFGRLIANNDQHFGNLSLRLQGARILGLAPAYDQLPMAYAPRANELVPVAFAPRLRASDGPFAEALLPVALGFWQAVAEDARISDDFRAIARENGRALRTLPLDRLPR